MLSTQSAKATELRGYRPVGPSREAEQIDASVCAESDCDECGHHGMRYQPYTQNGSYRAFAVCPRCKHSVEF